MPGPYESEFSGDSALQTARDEIATATDSVHQDLGRTRQELDELEHLLAPLAQTTSNIAGITSQLSHVVIAAAGEVSRSGPAGQSFMPLLEQLADIARKSLTALQDLERQSSGCQARVRTLLALTRQSRSALERIDPALRSLVDAPGTRADAPAVEVVVRGPLPATDKANRVAQLTDEVLRQRNQRTSGPKN
jgi:hypothetical protein